MPLPKPVQGLVIRYSYLWRDEHKRGLEEGVKDLPCAVVLATKTEEGEDIVTVLPVTHTPPTNPLFAIEILAATKNVWVWMTNVRGSCWRKPTVLSGPVLIYVPCQNPMRQASLLDFCPTNWLKK